MVTVLRCMVVHVLCIPLEDLLCHLNGDTTRTSLVFRGVTQGFVGQRHESLECIRWGSFNCHLSDGR